MQPRKGRSERKEKLAVYVYFRSNYDVSNKRGRMETEHHAQFVKKLHVALVWEGILGSGQSGK